MRESKREGWNWGPGEDMNHKFNLSEYKRHRRNISCHRSVVSISDDLGVKICDCVLFDSWVGRGISCGVCGLSKMEWLAMGGWRWGGAVTGIQR